jgi:hypothetical protein
METALRRHFGAGGRVSYGIPSETPVGARTLSRRVGMGPAEEGPLAQIDGWATVFAVPLSIQRFNV